MDLSLGGIQVFIATHSLFLLREIEMPLAGRSQEIDARFFGLHLSDAGVSVQQGPSVDDVGAIAALDEELEQSDRFLSPEERRRRFASIGWILAVRRGGRHRACLLSRRCARSRTIPAREEKSNGQQGEHDDRGRSVDR
ncbi:hypothetical protein WME76_21555 [Sorangium sp. So ce119]|uniref:hypothetical protein n=1 Tax=Sorangium sp. So ce119 TaxID=3133279 RepID=UPI003F603E2D